MSLPTPEPGLVIRYSYLWSREARRGRQEGVKDRPCAIVLAVKKQGQTRVYVLPITHAKPDNEGDAVEVPPGVKRRLGLDADASWIVVSEANVFRWPGPDLRFLRGKGPESIAYGKLPGRLFNIVRERFFDSVRRQRGGVVPRTD